MMKLPKYQLTSDEKLLSYEFISEDIKGRILKRIQFTLINQSGIFNLAFGDINNVTGEFDDLTISNNGDSEKVLSTVVSAIYAFSYKNPNAWVFASGSTPSRTRLYQINISKFLKEIKEDFDIYGMEQEDWVEFEIGKNYTSFLAKKKLNTNFKNMKTIAELNKNKIPIIIIDKRLNKLSETVLFPAKVENAINIIKKYGVPKV